jgi:hypothetical protein
MNLRHAAAFALVGWYLLEPPHVGEDGSPDKGVPLAQWEQMGSYTSAEECNADRESFTKRDQQEYNLSLRSKPPQFSLPTDAARAPKSSAAVCIATEDPRLKKE